jgi:hypothetical protein
MSTDIYEALNFYGVSYEGEQGSYVPTEDEMTLGNLVAEGGRIVRVRFIGGDYIPGRGKCYDVSYVHGEIPGECEGHESLAGQHMGETVFCDGTCSTPTRVSVNLQGCDDWNLIPRRGLKGAMIAWAKNEGVYAKGCGLLDDSNYSILG